MIYIPSANSDTQAYACPTNKWELITQAFGHGHAQKGNSVERWKEQQRKLGDTKLLLYKNIGGQVYCEGSLW